LIFNGILIGSFLHKVQGEERRGEEINSLPQTSWFEILTELGRKEGLLNYLRNPRPSLEISGEF